MIKKRDKIEKKFFFISPSAGIIQIRLEPQNQGGSSGIISVKNNLNTPDTLMIQVRRCFFNTGGNIHKISMP